MQTEVRRRIEALQARLVPILLEFDRGGVYDSELQDEAVKSSICEYYNICGDKALHMCILSAYKYEEGTLERRALVDVAKMLLQQCEEIKNDSIGGVSVIGEETGYVCV